MRYGLRVMTAGLALALAGAPTFAFGQDEEVVDPGADRKTSEDAAPGAASMEPAQALVDDPGYENSEGHQAWLDSIWNSP